MTDNIPFAFLYAPSIRNRCRTAKHLEPVLEKDADEG